ncbi:MAG TPA: hypothetical protein VKL22_07000, partial [Actinomycetota bacterium]|nr:hypothetical protein [Actinomycetota bacterium]
MRLLHRLGTLPFLATPGPSPSAWWLWLQRTAAQDAVASALRLIATGCAYWLLASTVLYLFARLGLSLFARPGRIHTLPRPIEWTTPAPVRRLVDQAVALSFVAGLAGTGAALASTGAPPPAPAPVVAVDGHTGVMVPAGARPLSPSVPAPPPRGPPVAPLAAPRGSSLHLVVPGDNLWSISAARLA